MNAEAPSILPSRDRPSREQAVVSSALWAAAGDALGWMTELTSAEAGVVRRTGSTTVSQPVDWQRMIGGRAGPRVAVPAGTYSDDTQLRLAVCRAIRGDGEFDVEAFAKVEVTVWPSYALGAGLGTKAAASNLSRRGVNWFSNFFESSGQNYVSGGGNGAAMRIQPHIWAAGADSAEVMIGNVLRDALVTHGHPHGFCGAIFHALCIAYALEHGSVPGPSDWLLFVERLKLLPKLIAADPQLAAFWQSAWEDSAGQSLSSAIETMRSEALGDIATFQKIDRSDPGRSYRILLDQTGCLTQRYRGSGFKTALAAVALAWLYRDRMIEEALILAANELDSDTDTIATMAGAIMGCVCGREPQWSVQDRDYVVYEARRLATIAAGRPQDSFSYPDLGRWSPPTRQTASVGLSGDGLALAGLGPLKPFGPNYAAGDALWQWFALPFGQTILAKRRKVVEERLGSSQLPGHRREPVRKAAAYPGAVQAPTSTVGLANDSQTNLFDQKTRPLAGRQEPLDPSGRAPGSGIDYWTDLVINNNFDDLTIGRAFNRLLDQTGRVETAVGFAAIIAKAKLMRGRRQRD